MDDPMKNHCTDQETGKLITLYELGKLREDQQERFEQHLMDCDFCLQELQALSPTIAALRNQREELVLALHNSGVSYAAQKRALLASRHPVRFSLWKRISEMVEDLVIPRELIPAVVVTAALVFLLIIPPSTQMDNPYLPYISFQKAPYSQGTLRSAAASEADQEFVLGMQQYLRSDYPAAIHYLSKAIELNPEEGEFLLYLGICYYLNRQAEPAIETLTLAEQATVYSLNSRARWYLAQSYLLACRAEEAQPILEGLSDQKRDYSQDADKLLKKIRSIQPVE